MQWRLHPDGVLLRSWQDGAAAFHGGSGDIYVLSPLCGAILERMQSSRAWCLESLVDGLLAECDAPPPGEDWSDLVRRALGSMERLRLIERQE
ncbi:MAG: HPr-rel-A system PqqD family peptide chaperone [Ectothiorhodospira sp.]